MIITLTKTIREGYDYGPNGSIRYSIWVGDKRVAMGEDGVRKFAAIPLPTALRSLIACVIPSPLGIALAAGQSMEGTEQ
jgi:hypothetical protein